MTSLRLHTNLASLDSSGGRPRIDVRGLAPRGTDKVAAAGSLLQDTENGQRFLHIFATAGPHALLAPTNAKASAWRNTGVGQFDGMCYNAFAQKSDGNNILSAGAFAMDGTAGLAGVVQRTVPRGQVDAGPLLGVWTDQMWVGGTGGFVDAQGRAGIHLGFMLSGRAHNGCEVTLPGLPSCREAKVTVHEQRLRQWVLNPAASLMALLRILCRVDCSRVSDTRYEANVDLASACALMPACTSAFSRWVMGTWNALRGHHPLPIPSLLHPERLRANEKRSSLLAVQNNAFASFGAWNIFGGYQRTQTHQSRVTTKRDDKDNITISWTQTQMPSTRFFGVVTGGLGIDTGHHAPLVEKRTLTLNLAEVEGATEPARAMGRKNVRGALAAYRDFVAVLQQNKAADEEQAAFRRFTDDPFVKEVGLRRGGVLSVTEKTVGGTVKSDEIGGRLGLFPNGLWSNVLPSGFVQAIAANMEKRHLQRRVRGPDGTEQHLAIRLQQSQHVLGPNGVRRAQIVGVIVGGDETDNAPEVVVGSRFHVGRADADEVQRLIINPLNNHLDARLAPLRGAGWRVSRDVSVERRLNAEDLAYLSQLDVAQQQQVVASSHVCADLFAAMMGKLADSRVRKRCEAVQEFIESAGLPGLGALRHAFSLRGDDAAHWMVDTASDAYTAPFKSFDALRILALDPAQRNSDSFRNACEVTRGALLAAVDLAEHDPFLSLSKRRDQCLKLRHVITKLEAWLSRPKRLKVGKPNEALGFVGVKIQKFLREHSAPRFCYKEEDIVSGRKESAELLQELRELGSSTAEIRTLQALLSPWSAEKSSW